MIIFFESGRLGNQLFQYCAMRKYQPNGPILTIGMSELKRGFDGINLVDSKDFGRLLEWILRRIGERLIGNASGHRRLLTLVEEVKTSIGASFQITPGFLRCLVYFKPGYYQTEAIVEADVMSRISLKTSLVRKAQDILRPLNVHPHNRFFVHVRRGDYIQWPSVETPAVLNLGWYLSQMERVRREHPDAFFVVLSDDPPYVSEFFYGYNDISVVHQEALLDFSVITQCHGGGILSASSFAWWGAYFIKRENPNALLIAPRYWAGHRSKQWYPPNIQTSWLVYTET